MVNGKYPRGMQSPFSIPLLIKREILFREKHSLGQDRIGKNGLMCAASQTHCSDGPISQMSSPGKNPYHEQADTRLSDVRSAVIKHIPHTAEWDTINEGKYIT